MRKVPYVAERARRATGLGAWRASRPALALSPRRHGSSRCRWLPPRPRCLGARWRWP
jgi:hypothetical protein